MASSSGMSSILKYGALAAGLYLVYRSGIVQNLMASITGGTVAAPPATTPGTTTTGGGGGTDTGTPPATTTTPPNTKLPINTTPSVTDQVALAHALDARARADGLAAGTKISAGTGWDAGQVQYNVWQWNYVFKELHPAGANLNTSNNAAVMGADAYVAARASGGLGLSGLGTFAAMRRPVFNPAVARMLQSRAAQGDLLAAIHLVNMGARIPRPVSGTRLSLSGLALPVVVR